MAMRCFSLGHGKDPLACTRKILIIARESFCRLVLATGFKVHSSAQVSSCGRPITPDCFYIAVLAVFQVRDLNIERSSKKPSQFYAFLKNWNKI
jgi:hypothetical protein